MWNVEGQCCGLQQTNQSMGNTGTVHPHMYLYTCISTQLLPTTTNSRHLHESMELCYTFCRKEALEYIHSNIKGSVCRIDWHLAVILASPSLSKRGGGLQVTYKKRKLLYFALSNCRNMADSEEEDLLLIRRLHKHGFSFSDYTQMGT